MDSPSAQLVEPSLIDFGGPPSSPFVSEVDAQSRAASRHWPPDAGDSTAEEQKKPAVAAEPVQQYAAGTSGNKENVPEQDPTLALVFATPKQSASKESTRSTSASPRPVSTAKKTPLKLSGQGARTPRSRARGDDSERSAFASHMQSAARSGVDSRMSQASTDEHTSVDDTCFSNFSQVPDLTAYSKLNESPSKRSDVFATPRTRIDPTPRTSRKRSSPSRSPSPTPRKMKTPARMGQDGTTSFLIDFTQQMEGFNGSNRAGSPAKSATESNLLQYINSQRSPNKGAAAPRQSFATPSKPNSLLNLLDFELPPAPTPRSVPTITVRELESLKSSYLSQISSLKATLSGREAEVESLKRAVADAERRAGEAQESLREEKCRGEQIEQEKEGWEKRGLEVEQLLKSVKEEVIKGEAEKEDMANRLEETAKAAEDAEERATKAEERFADAVAASSSGKDGDAGAMEEQVQRLVAAQIDAKIEAVSRELHAVYKEKHERKVTTLKKSYEARADKKMGEMQTRIAVLEKENQDLQAAKDATFSGPVGDISMAKGDNVELKAQLEEQKAHTARVESEMQVSRAHQEQLERELQQERIEKGDLVAAVDEMLALQAEHTSTPGPKQMQGAMDMVHDFRKSIGRPGASKVAAPGESRIGRAGAPTSVGRNFSGGGGKSRMLANIERMGRTGSKDGSNGL